MKLSRKIPARTEAVRFNWCQKDFMQMCQRYRDVRSRMKRPNDACRWCRHKFVDGEMMALAQPQKGLNWLLCSKCADELLNEEG